MEWPAFLALLGVAAAILLGAVDRVLIFLLEKRRTEYVKKQLDLKQQIRDADKDVAAAKEGLNEGIQKMRNRANAARKRINDRQGSGSK